MPTTVLKDNLQRLLRSVMIMHAFSGPCVAASPHAGALALRGRGTSHGSRLVRTGAAVSATVYSAVCAIPMRPWALASWLFQGPGDHVSMNRRALLVCLALGAWSQAGAQALGRESPEVQKLIEALRPVPATRGIEQPHAAASADLTIEFEPGSVRLTEQGRRSLDTLGTALGSDDLEPYQFRIEVHVESGATASRDQLLSKRQANAIKDYLVKQYQLSPRRLATDGRGSAQPIKRTNPAAPVNRRVVVVNMSSVQ
jgi:outer membrane protein OmpA-like peptidoglycan-associated protein